MKTPNLQLPTPKTIQLALLSWMLGFVACAGSPPLAHVQPSPEVLARSVLSAMERRDAAALRTLAVSEAEFRHHVWPELPAARPERNLPFSYVWSDLRQKSERQLAQTLRTHGGRRYEFVRLAFGRSTRYASYVVHRETTLVVRNDDGAEEQLRLFGSTLAKGDGFKIFSFVVD